MSQLTAHWPSSNTQTCEGENSHSHPHPHPAPSTQHHPPPRRSLALPPSLAFSLHPHHQPTPTPTHSHTHQATTKWSPSMPSTPTWPTSPTSTGERGLLVLCICSPLCSRPSSSSSSPQDRTSVPNFPQLFFTRAFADLTPPTTPSHHYTPSHRPIPLTLHVYTHASPPPPTFHTHDEHYALVRVSEFQSASSGSRCGLRPRSPQASLLD